MVSLAAAWVQVVITIFPPVQNWSTIAAGHVDRGLGFMSDAGGDVPDGSITARQGAAPAAMEGNEMPAREPWGYVIN